MVFEDRILSFLQDLHTDRNRGLRGCRNVDGPGYGTGCLIIGGTIGGGNEFHTVGKRSGNGRSQ